MGTKMKGIYKGFKCISNIFVVKEREIEIGYPTDVKHVAHIGWDGPSGNGPTWMNEFKTGPEFAATAIDYGDSTRHQTAAEIYKDVQPADVPSQHKKHKRRKPKPTSSPKSSSPKSSSSFRSRAGKSKTKFAEGNPKPANIQVA